MSSSSSNSKSNGGGLTTTLFVVFLILKLVGAIGWSWWWVFAPLWIPLAFWAALIVLVATGAIVVKATRN